MIGLDSHVIRIIIVLSMVVIYVFSTINGEK